MSSIRLHETKKKIKKDPLESFMRSNGKVKREEKSFKFPFQNPSLNSSFFYLIKGSFYAIIRIYRHARGIENSSNANDGAWRGNEFLCSLCTMLYIKIAFLISDFVLKYLLVLFCIVGVSCSPLECERGGKSFIRGDTRG
jgi:hypothetical protein